MIPEYCQNDATACRRQVDTRHRWLMKHTAPDRRLAADNLFVWYSVDRIFWNLGSTGTDLCKCFVLPCCRRQVFFRNSASRHNASVHSQARPTIEYACIDVTAVRLASRQYEKSQIHLKLQSVYFSVLLHARRHTPGALRSLALTAAQLGQTQTAAAHCIQCPNAVVGIRHRYDAVGPRIG